MAESTEATEPPRWNFSAEEHLKEAEILLCIAKHQIKEAVTDDGINTLPDNPSIHSSVQLSVQIAQAHAAIAMCKTVARGGGA